MGKRWLLTKINSMFLYVICLLIATPNCANQPETFKTHKDVPWMARWGWRRKKCQHYLPYCRYGTNQPHRFQANLRNLIEIAAENQATCSSCMHRKSAGKNVMIHAVAMESLQVATEACYVCISQKMQVRDPSAPASGRARRIFAPVHHLMSPSWTVEAYFQSEKAPRVWLRIDEKHDPKLYYASLLIDRRHDIYELPRECGFLQLCRANAFSKSNSRLMYWLQGMGDPIARLQSLGSIHTSMSWWIFAISRDINMCNRAGNWISGCQGDEEVMSCHSPS